MKISVITATFNRASTLSRSLASVLDQSHAPIEHLLIDNCSTDTTADVIAEYARRAPYRVQHICGPDTGMYEALNKGIGRATGDAIYILNDDDAIADADGLRLLGACMEQTAADIVYGDIYWLDPGTEVRTLRRHNQLNKMNLVHKGINQPAMLHRASVYRRCGVYDESYRIAADHEWLLRVFFKYDLAATYLRHPIAVCSLGGLSNAEAWRQRCSAERHRVTNIWYSAMEVARSNLYRRFFRKVPFGTHLFHLFQPLKLRVRAVRPVAGGFGPDLAAALGF